MSARKVDHRGRSIQYLREYAMLEVIYDDLDNKELSKDPDEVRCIWPTWQKFVLSAPSSYASTLAARTWKDWEEPTVDELPSQLWQYEESLSSSRLVYFLAVAKLSQKVHQLKENVLEKLSQEVHQLKEK